MPNRARPVLFMWNGEHMVPDPRYRKMCAQLFKVGEEYPLIVFETRSHVSHKHYFASVHAAWENLPYGIVDRFPSSEHLRRWALVEAGYADETVYVCDTEKEARRLAALTRDLDGYAVIKISGNIVKVWRARSQSVSAMSGEEFQKSKTAVLEIVAGMIDTSPKTLTDNAGKSS